MAHEDEPTEEATKTDSIFKLFQEYPEKSFKPEEIRKILDINYNTVSGTIYRLMKNEKIVRAHRGYYKFNDREEISEDEYNVDSPSNKQDIIEHNQNHIDIHISETINNIIKEQSTSKRIFYFNNLIYISKRYQMGFNTDMIKFTNSFMNYCGNETYDYFIKILINMYKYEVKKWNEEDFKVSYDFFVQKTTNALKDIITLEYADDDLQSELWLIYIYMASIDDVLDKLCEIIENDETYWTPYENKIEYFIKRVAKMDKDIRNMISQRLFNLLETMDTRQTYKIHNIFNIIRNDYYAVFFFDEEEIKEKLRKTPT